ncbi:2'-5' RNA ligase family protein [Flavitalea sp.]|nr:2'-5' RNA ligase family protein [Flavitalea sp.]
MQNQHETNEYLLVAYPDKSVLDKIAAEKALFNETYKLRPKASLKPHILVTNFFASEGMESTLIRWLQRICSLEQGFRLTLNNYSGYPTHTIFLRVQDAGPVQHFVAQLNTMKDFIQAGPGGFFRRPHVPVASKLSTGVYEQALSDYSRKIFHESFVVEELVLLKRKDSYETLRTVQVFGLLPLNNDLFNKVA